MLGALTSRDKEKVYQMRPRDGEGNAETDQVWVPGHQQEREEVSRRDNGPVWDVLGAMSAEHLRRAPLRLLDIGPKGTEGGKIKVAPLEGTLSVPQFPGHPMGRAGHSWERRPAQLLHPSRHTGSVLMSSGQLPYPRVGTRTALISLGEGEGAGPSWQPLNPLL